MKHLFIVGIAFLFFSQESIAATCNKTIYVKSSATGANDGTSWKDAYVKLQNALGAAYICSDIQEIWVAQGSYRPTVDILGGSSNASPQSRTFTIYGNIKMYGGFRGDEGEITKRIPYLYPTVLTGDQKDDDILTEEPGAPMSASDNSFNIMRMKYLTPATIIDGFVFQGGNAISQGSDGFQKVGGAIFNDGSGTNKRSNPVIKNCSFRHNAAILAGGAIYNSGLNGNANPTIINCDFRYNAALFFGGAVTNISMGDGFISNHKYENCVFFKNKASKGGAIATQIDNLASVNGSYLNCTFVDNESDTGGGIYTDADTGQGDLNITGCIFYSNIATAASASDFYTTGLDYDVSYSNFSVAPVPADADGNIGGDPEFSSDVDLRLDSDSPLIDIGPFLPGGIQDRDRDNHARVINGRMDMGAYEKLLCPANNEIYVNAIQLSSTPDGGTFEKALTYLHEGILMANGCSAEPTIFLSEGTYYPQEYYDGILPMEEVRKDFIFSIDRDMNIIGGLDRYNNQSNTQGFSIISGDFNNDDNIALSEKQEENAERIIITKGQIGRTINSLSMKNISFTKFVSRPFGRSLIDIGRRTLQGINYKVQLENCEFLNNKYHGNSGLLSITSSVDEGYESDVQLRSCRFQDNIGRALYIRHFDGGGKVLLDSIEMIDNSNDSQEQSGGVFIFVSDDASLDVNIDNSIFQGNSTAYNGAAVAMKLGVISNVTTYVDINNCDFIDNQSDRDGGAISFLKAVNARSVYGSIKVRNSLFSGNSGRYGGGISIEDIGTNVDISVANSLFYFNRSIGFSNFGTGAALAMTGVGLSKITNCTFYQNIADTEGGAISLGGITDAQIANSIFWLNKSMQGLEINSIYKSNSSLSTTIMTHSLTELSVCPDNVNSCTSMIFDQNPLLNIDLGSSISNLVPFSNSPVIDAGSNELSPDEIYDFVGSRVPYYFGQPNYRIKNNTIDIGAQEFRGDCVDDLVLNPTDSIFVADNGVIRGAWAANNKITVLPGFTTTEMNHLILDAYEIEIVNDYSFLSSNQLLINTEGCQN